MSANNTNSGNQVLSLVHKPTGEKLAVFVTQTTAKSRGRGAEKPVTRAALACSRMTDNHLSMEYYVSRLPDNLNLTDFIIEVRDEF